jgi:hypothetical protein
MCKSLREARREHFVLKSEKFNFWGREIGGEGGAFTKGRNVFSWGRTPLFVLHALEPRV